MTVKDHDALKQCFGIKPSDYFRHTEVQRSFLGLDPETGVYVPDTTSRSVRQTERRKKDQLTESFTE